MSAFPSAGDLRAAKEFLRTQKRSSLLFSEGTYQAEVHDAQGRTFWPFLQLDDEGKLLDCFCSCGDAEQKKSCLHLAVAWLKIFRRGKEPLHVRFRESLWNKLCQIGARRHGYDPKILQGEGTLRAYSLTGNPLFELTALNAEGRGRIDQILVHRPVETEETSIKFSNLSAEELLLWRQGRPSAPLRYRLSFWCDLAQWWMHLQETSRECRVQFSKEVPPERISARFAQVAFCFHVAESNWPDLIPALATVPSPLKVYDLPEKNIRKITYHPDDRSLHLVHAILRTTGRPPPNPLERGTPVGDWLYLPNKGWIPKVVDPLLTKDHIASDQVGRFFQQYGPLLRKTLEGTQIHPTPMQASTQLFFDGQHHLHLCCYLFEQGDMQQPGSALFGSWVYLPDRGFYLVDNLPVEGTERVVAKQDVSDFISSNRTWLSMQEGFQIHHVALEPRWTYALDAQGLHFEMQAEMAEEAKGILDLGEWIYIKGRGLYSKRGKKEGFLLQPGLCVPLEEIPSFIQRAKEELDQVVGFFALSSPIVASGVELLLNEQGRIALRPKYLFLPQYERVQVIADFTYVEGEGFCQIPPTLRLPPLYQKERIIEPSQQAQFLDFELPAIEPFLLSCDPRLRRPKQLQLHILRIQRDETAKTGSWLIDLEYVSEVGQTDAIELWRAIASKQGVCLSRAGSIFLQHPRFHWLRALSKKRWSKGGKRVRLSTLEWIRLRGFEELIPPTAQTRQAEASRKLLEEMQSLQTDRALDLTGLKSDLRHYQETGLKWLWFLYCFGLSGLLCDEMGLGKTHQAMALIAAARNAKKGAPDKYLVVCPTSVIYHWEDLLARFFPSLRCYIFHGSLRKLEPFTTHHDLLVTSYGTIRSDREALAKISFEVAIFDEIQNAKNPYSQTHKALRSMQAKMRIGLSGTPIENRLLELKALFDIVVPSFMPSDALFRELFVYPIERSQDAEKRALLSRLVRPLILRRKKAEVLLELPEKIEEISYCALSEEQQRLYKEAFLEKRDTLMRELYHSRASGAYLHIFALFSKLKQICNHPCLLTKQFDEYHKHASGKWDLFVELLDEIRDSGQKVVIFSQYLEMLDLIERHLQERGMGYAGIRGATRDRKEQLHRFREDPQCEVFVASLQAAGVGVDLVSASCVIHYDRWWNPAKENQATDRVHRIGQNRGVQVFKLVTKHTIEEHIHRLIEKKRELLEGVIGYDDQEQIKRLEREELIALMHALGSDLGN